MADGNNLIFAAHFMGTYYLPVTNNALSPKFCSGEMIVVDPIKPLCSADYAVCWIGQGQYYITKASTLPHFISLRQKWYGAIMRWFYPNKTVAHAIIGRLEYPSEY